MRYISLLLMLFIVIVFNACDNLDEGRKFYNYTFNLASQIVKYDDKLYFRYYENNKDQPFNETNTSLLYEFNDQNKSWYQIASKNDTNVSILNDYTMSKIQDLYNLFDEENIINTTQYIVFNENKATIKDIDTNETVESITLPSAYEVASNLSLSIVNGVYKVEYKPFIETQYVWSKKRYIMFFATNKERNYSGAGGYYDRYTGYYISILKNDNNSWEYELLDTKHNYNIDEHNIGGHTYLSFDGKASIYYQDGKYITLNDNKISIKKLFGQLYNKEFENTIHSIYNFGSMEIYNGNHGTYTFDEKGNMHLFYNKREDIINKNYDYFWYAYFEKENPSTPLYEQKIPWK
ncbi:MAG: hypothetical protein FAF05_02495 [Epsilonproteobacteria bacterium]|nr:hypothetical protein [Campylobacterota bacterium]